MSEQHVGAAATPRQFATISFFINDPKSAPFDDEECEILRRAIAEHYAARLRDSALGAHLAVCDSRVRRGCVIVTLSLGALIGYAGGAFASVTAFLAAYPKIREGAILLGKDLRHLRLQLSSRSEALTAWYYTDTFDAREVAGRLGGPVSNAAEPHSEQGQDRSQG